MSLNELVELLAAYLTEAEAIAITGEDDTENADVDEVPLSDLSDYFESDDESHERYIERLRSYVAARPWYVECRGQRFSLCSLVAASKTKLVLDADMRCP